MTTSKAKAKVAPVSANTDAQAKDAEAKPVRTALEEIIVERRESVGLITLNRPKSLNALNLQLASEVMRTLKEFDADDRIGGACASAHIDHRTFGRSQSLGSDCKIGGVAR